jgi:hypothetical protein
MRRWARKVSATFCEQKVAKKLWNSGSWALVKPTPMTQSHESFLLLFFKKEALPHFTS